MAIGLWAAAQADEQEPASPAGSARQAGSSEQRPKVKHPNLSLNRKEIEQSKHKIRTQDWQYTAYMIGVEVCAVAESELQHLP